MRSLRTKQVLELLGRAGTHIIDARSIDAYNGWRFRGEARGGHIAGAKSLPFKWTRYIDWMDIVAAKGIAPSDEIVVYGYSEEEIRGVAEHFSRAGYPRVFLYRGFIPGWCGDASRPMSRLARYRQLVSAGWLRSLVDDEPVPEYDNDKYVVCHAHYRNRRAYEKGHIPGAIPLDTNTLESPSTWNRRNPAELREQLQSMGISHDTTVVLYGRYAFPNNDAPFPGSSAGHLGAMRCAFIMLYAGVKDVRILNGGLQAWLDEGLPLSTAESPPAPAADFGTEIPARPQLAVDTDEAKRIIGEPGRNLVCVRSWREYIGEVSGYNYINKKGRIPGAVFADCGTDAYHMENYRNLDHTMRDFEETTRVWDRAGITPECENAFYCGTGWRASEAFINAWLMGWPRISVYDGGWFEWSRDPSNACETGVPL